MPIQPKTSNILPKFCQKLATTLRVRRRTREWGINGATATTVRSHGHLALSKWGPTISPWFSPLSASKFTGGVVLKRRASSEADAVCSRRSTTAFSTLTVLKKMPGLFIFPYQLRNLQNPRATLSPKNHRALRNNRFGDKKLWSVLMTLQKASKFSQHAFKQFKEDKL